MKREIIGFDIRELWLDENYIWTSENKNKYLLRHNVIRPLSLSRHIWYTVFSEIEEQIYGKSVPQLWAGIPRKNKFINSYWNKVFDDTQMIAYPEQSYYHPNRGGTWSDLSELEKHINIKWGELWRPTALIAIEEVLFEDYEDENPIIINPNSIQDDWKLLGYDVADYDLYTGLFIGEKSGKLDPLTHIWVNNLNQYHLFEDIESAYQYIPFGEEKYPSHAPYSVYGLYLIKTINTEWID